MLLMSSFIIKFFRKHLNSFMFNSACQKSVKVSFIMLLTLVKYVFIFSVAYVVVLQLFVINYLRRFWCIFLFVGIFLYNDIHLSKQKYLILKRLSPKLKGYRRIYRNVVK